MKRQRFLLWLLFFTLGTVVMSAQGLYQLKGVVEDNSHEPLIGATVMVKGTNNGVATDIDGNYAVMVKNGDILVVSYVGYTTQEIKVDGQKTLNVVLLEDTANLEEVVVVGYGTMKKKDLTGAVTQIDPEKMADKNPGTVSDLLKGVPGLQIGYNSSAKGGGSIQLRGQNSVYDKSGHNSPLIVVDGMIFYGELSEINPDDIAQIDVLKDASSTAVYGARAAAGVIIISTKRGKQGKPKINVSANFGWDTKAYARKAMGVQEMLNYREEYFRSLTYGFDDNGNYGAYNGKDGNGNLLVQPGYYEHYSNASKYGLTTDQWAALGTNPEGASLDEIYFRRIYNLNGDTSIDLLDNFLNGRTVDWTDLTYRTGFCQDYNASMSGATERVNYYFSFGFLRNEGVLEGDMYRAFRSNIKLDGKITNWLSVGANINFQDRTEGSLSCGVSNNYWDDDMIRNSPFGNYRDEDGNLVQYPMGTNEKRGYNYEFQNQYLKLDKGYTVFNSIFNIKVSLPFNINYTFNIAPRYQYFHDRYFMSADLPNSNPKDRGVNREWAKQFDWSLNNTITWDYTIAEKNRFVVTLVQEAEENKYWKDRIEARNILPSDALGFHNTQNATIADSKFQTTDTHYTADAWMGRLFYSFDDRYMLTATIRRDGYCAFGQNNPHATFPSVALGWTFTNEKFMEGTNSWLSNGKLRLSWGKNGNRSLEDPYISLANLGSGVGATMTYLDKNGNPATEYKYLMMDRLANPNLQWEKTTAYNVGLDLGFLNNRLSANSDFYHKETHDMIMQMKLPGFSGFSSIWTNIGQVNNTGVEVALNSINITNPDFTWTTSLGFSYNKNSIKHLNGEMEDIFDAAGNVIGQKEMDDTGNKWFIGKPIGVNWTYKMVGIWQPEEADQAALVGQRPGDPKALNAYTEDDIILDDGTRVPVYNEKDKVFEGTWNAPYYFNMRNEFKYKDFTFGFTMYSFFGHKHYRTEYMNHENSGNLFVYGYNKRQHSWWTPENRSNDFARFEAQLPAGVSELGKFYNSSFLRLDNVSLGYNLPAKLTQKAGIERVRISASIDNLFTIHCKNWEYGDIETAGLSTRKYNVGIQLTL